MGPADPPPRPQGGIGPQALSHILHDKDSTAGTDAGRDAGKIARSIDCSIVGSIVGTWRLAMTRGHDDAGQPMHAPYGPVPMGVVMFAADGRMVAVLCDARSQLPAGEEEREYSSYCGSYTFDGTMLVTRVDAASDRSRLGGDQIRRVRFDGERLVLMPPPRPWRGVMQHREMYFERIA
jgi:Lipocalin-like domain